MGAHHHSSTFQPYIEAIGNPKTIHRLSIEPPLRILDASLSPHSCSHSELINIVEKQSQPIEHIH